MAEYIEREAALAFPFANGKYDHENANEHFIFGCESYKEWLEQLPTADVVSVVRGKWIADGDGYHWTYNCSICGWKDGYPFNKRHNFCPNCGADMRGEGNG